MTSLPIADFASAFSATVSYAIAFAIGWWCHNQLISPGPVEASTPSDAPQVVVNVPTDYKPLPTLDGKEVIVGERALLYHAVFVKALAELGRSPSSEPADDVRNASEAASDAVNKVYGS